MLQWFIAVNRLLRSVRKKAADMLSLLEKKKKDKAGAKVIDGYGHERAVVQFPQEQHAAYIWLIDKYVGDLPAWRFAEINGL